MTRLFLENVLKGLTSDELSVLELVYSEEAMWPQAIGRPKLVKSLLEDHYLVRDREWITLPLHVHRALRERHRSDAKKKFQS